MLKRVIEQKYIAPSLSSLGLSLCVHVYNNFHFKFFFSFGVDINECQISNPCKNGGQCENTHGSYECNPIYWCHLKEEIFLEFKANPVV